MIYIDTIFENRDNAGDTNAGIVTDNSEQCSSDHVETQVDVETLDEYSCLNYALEQMQIVESEQMRNIRRRFSEEELTIEEVYELLGKYQDVARSLMSMLDQHDQVVTTRADIGLLLMSAILCYQQGFYDDYHSNVDDAYDVLASVGELLGLEDVEKKIESLF